MKNDIKLGVLFGLHFRPGTKCVLYQYKTNHVILICNCFLLFDLRIPQRKKFNQILM